MSQTEMCPVKGCTNPRDRDNGHLCWRHRQFVKPVDMGAIRRAETNLRKCTDEKQLPFFKGELTKAVNAVAAKAAATEQFIRSTRKDGGQ